MGGGGGDIQPFLFLQPFITGVKSKMKELQILSFKRRHFMARVSSQK